MASSFAYLELVDFWSTVVRSYRPDLSDSRWALITADSRILALSRSCRAFGLRPGGRIADARSVVRTLRTLSIPPRLLQQEVDAFEAIVSEAGGIQEFVEPGRVWIRFDDLSDIEVQVRVERVVEYLETRFSGHARAGIGAERFLARQACSELSTGVSQLGSSDFLARCGGRPFGIIPGIPPEVRRELWAFGLRTVEDLARTDAESLRPYFGDDVDVWIRRARGESMSHAEPSPSSADIAQHGPRDFENIIFSEKSQHRGVVRRRIERSARAADTRLRALGRASWEHEIKIVWSDGTETTARSASVGQNPTDLPTTFLRMFRFYDLGGVIERVDLIAGGLRYRTPEGARFGSSRFSSARRRVNPAMQTPVPSEVLPLFQGTLPPGDTGRRAS